MIATQIFNVKASKESVVLAPENNKRVNMIIFNNSTIDQMFVRYGDPCDEEYFSLKVSAQKEHYVLPGYLGVLTAFWIGGRSGGAKITELYNV